MDRPGLAVTAQGSKAQSAELTPEDRSTLPVWLSVSTQTWTTAHSQDP